MKVRRIAAVLVVAAAGLLGAVVLIGQISSATARARFNDSTNEMLARFGAALAAGDYARAYAETAEEFRAKVAEAEFVARLSELERAAGRCTIMEGQTMNLAEGRPTRGAPYRMVFRENSPRTGFRERVAGFGVDWDGGAARLGWLALPRAFPAGPDVAGTIDRWGRDRLTVDLPAASPAPVGSSAAAPASGGRDLGASPPRRAR